MKMTVFDLDAELALELVRKGAFRRQTVRLGTAIRVPC
jgi:hypothetical protein